MINDGDVILFQGDSITDCGRRRDFEQTLYNTEMGDGYARMITADLRASRPGNGLNFLNRGISGNRVVDLYARWKSDALNLKPDLISILVGVNDTWHHFHYDNGVEPKRYEQIYRMLLEWTKENLSDTRLVLMEPFILPCGAVGKDWGGEMDERREIVRTLSRDFETLFVPLQDLLTEKAARTGPEYWLADGVHPTAAGHRLIADRWLEVVAG